MEKYTKAVSATLAGALAVGMVPAMALADEAAPEVVADDGVELLVAGDPQDIAAGTITGVKGEKDLAKIVLTKGEYKAAPEVTEITTQNGVEIDPANTKDAYDYDFVTEYWMVVDPAEATSEIEAKWAGEDVYVVKAGEDINEWAPGTYYMTIGTAAVVTTTNEATVDVPCLAFTVAAGSLDGAYFCEADAKGVYDPADKTFAYTGEPLNIGLTFGEKGDLSAVDDTENDIVEDYSLMFYPKKADGSGYNTTAGVAQPTAAGTYAVVITGENDYIGYSKTTTIEVAKMNLANVKLELDDAVAYAQVGALADDGEELASDINLSLIKKVDAVEVVNTEAAGEFADNLVLSYNDGILDNVELKKGKHTYKLSAVPGANNTANPNIEGTQTVTIVRYANEAHVEYNGSDELGDDAVYNEDGDVTTAFNPVNTGAKAFDPTKISVVREEGSDKEVAYTVSYEKYNETKGIWEAYSNFNEPGNYKAVVVVDDNTYTYGGKEDIYFTVAGSAVANIYASHESVKGYLPDTWTPVYTGEDVLEGISFDVYDAAGKKLTEGTDYTVAAVDAKGDSVTEIVNAGTYKVSAVAVSGSSWKMPADNSVSITVTEALVTPVIAGQKTVDGETGLPYTGEAIEPVVLLYQNAGPNFAAGVVAPTDDDFITALPTDAYEITEIEFLDAKGGPEVVDAMLEVGEYAVTVELTEAAAKNFDLVVDDGDVVTINVEVIDAKVFADVPAAAWYAEYVEAVDAMGLMTGYNGTNFFGPNDELIRGDAALILYRLAGGNGTQFDLGQIADLVEQWPLPDNAQDNMDDIISILKELNAVLSAPAEGTVGGNAYVNPFSDVSNEYYAQAIQWANKMGIMTGYKGTDLFGDEDPLTREQLAATLCRFAEAAGYDVEADAAVLTPYADEQGVSAWAEHCVAWAVESDLMGVDTDYLKPGQNISRAEMAAMIVRFMEWMVANA